MARVTSPGLQTSTTLTTDGNIGEPPSPDETFEASGPPRVAFGIGPWNAVKPTHPVTHFTGLSARFNLTDGPTVRFTMPADSEAARAASGLASALWVYSNGVLVDILRVLPIDQDWPATGIGPVTITAVGDKQVLSERHIVSGPPTFNQIDEGLILWSLVQHTQGQPGGDLGIVADEILTGTLRDRNEYQIGQRLGNLMEDLGNVEDGVWWGVSRKRFSARKWTSFPTRDLPIVHGTNAVAMSRQRGRFANVAGAAGARQHTTPVWVSSPDLTTDPRGRWEAFDNSHASTILQASVNEYATGLLASCAHPTATWKVTLDPEWYFDQGARYEPGDFVRIAVPISAVDEVTQPADALCQITEVSWSVDGATGGVAVSLAAVELEAIPIHEPPPTPDPPVNTSLPALSSPSAAWQVDTVWSCSTGTWNNASSFAYEWEQAPDVSGPWTAAPASGTGGSRTSAAYTPPASSAGQRFRCRVTALGPGGTLTVSSDVKQAVAQAVVPAPVNTAAPALSTSGATFNTGEVWTCSPGTWTDATTFEYWWQMAPTENGVYTVAPASSAGGSQTGSTYIPTATVGGNWFRCRVTATGAGGSTPANSDKKQATAPAAGSLLAAPPAGYALVGGTFSLWNEQKQTLAGYKVWRDCSDRYADICHFYVTSITGWNGTISTNWADHINLRPGGKSRLCINLKIASRNTRAAIATGAEDAQLTTIANNLKNWDDVLYLVLDHEAENAGGLSTLQAQNDYADAIRRCYQVIKPIAPNVDIGICPTGYSGDAGANGSRYNAMWPGDDCLDTCWWDPYFQTANRRDWVRYKTSGGVPRSLLNENVAGTTNWPGFLAWLRQAGTVGTNQLRYAKAGGTTSNPVKKGIGEWGIWKNVNPNSGAIDSEGKGMTDAEAEARARSVRDQYTPDTDDVFAILHYWFDLHHFNITIPTSLEASGLQYLGAGPRFNYDLEALR